MPKIKQSVKKTGKARKEVIVAQLVEKMDASSGLVFTDYKGITHQQLENLKKELKTVDSTIVIAKNSLIRLGLEKSKNFADFKDNEGLEAPTATLFIQGDMVEPLKRLQKTVKELGLPKIKFAILEGNLADEASVLKIAALPNRETLIAQFVGMLNSPIQGFVSGLNAIPQKFVMTLDAIAKAKPADAILSTDGTNPATPAPATEPTPAPASETATESATPENTETTQLEEGMPTEAAEIQSDTPAEESEPEETQAPADAAAQTDTPEGEETPAEEVKETDETVDEKEVK